MGHTMSALASPGDSRAAHLPSTARLKMVVVDDEPLARLGLSRLFSGVQDVELIGEADSVLEGQRLVTRLSPMLLVTELGLGGQDGLAFIRWVADEHPRVRVVALSGRDPEAYAERALKAGAMAFVSKREPLEALVGAVRDAAAGRMHLPSEVAQRMILSRVKGARAECGIEALTDREIQVFELIGHGACTHEIAVTLRLSEKTVACHRSHIKEKLGLERLTDLLRHAVLWVEHRSLADGG